MPNKFKCVELGKPYTVCYDTHATQKMFTSRRRGSLHCGIYVGGAKALRQNGHEDCLGGCNEGAESCDLHEWRGGCFMHDVCSITMNAAGFYQDKNCGNEALSASDGVGRCRGDQYNVAGFHHRQVPWRYRVRTRAPSPWPTPSPTSMPPPQEPGSVEPGDETNHSSNPSNLLA